jgi:2,4-dienoyl-CoA reductase-like NADH-dependent reductase (Old Yellow Enzyme family)
MAKLFDPLRVGNLTLKNRIVMPPMANDLAEGVCFSSCAHHFTKGGASATEGQFTTTEQGAHHMLTTKCRVT